MNSVSNSDYACASALLFAVSVAAFASDPPLPLSGDAQHLGAATCAGASCHAASHPAPGVHIQQNEFFVWEREDAHSNAYRLLSSERGKKIATALGLGNPAGAPR